MKKYIMALDQGTTSSRCILFTKDGSIASMVQREFAQLFPKECWVEHDPMTIWSTQAAVATEALLKIGASWSDVIGIGITNQRETTVVWDKKTGEPIYNAIVWQCRRTADLCKGLSENGYDKIIKKKTGLLIDPYFSATKIKWILDNVDGARERAKRGELAFGTIDSWIIWKLTGGKVHATDYSNASRTMLYNINTLKWDTDILELLDIPASMLPEVKPSSSLFGYTDEAVIGGKVAIGGVAGDQQAALFGQCCFGVGDLKNTYGTGGFLLMNTGEHPCFTENGLITTIAWGLGDKVYYALEGSVFTCGAAIQWLRDGMKLIESAQDSEYYASKVKDSGGVLVVPAFQGLGAPWWDPYARGMIIGITRATNKYHIIRATLESMAYQTTDVINLMQTSIGKSISSLKVDGGASANNLLMQFQSDILGTEIERPSCVETTALGAAYLCALTLGVYNSLQDINTNRRIDKIFSPNSSEAWRKEKTNIWRKAVERTLNWKND
ncbi:MAG: glycerol kinase GlpK [Ruminococcaceae bacterium]|nr:glycerol kinase GlpK [Oscillospiraceae bacterium]